MTRALDVAIAAVGLLISLPIWAVASILIKLESSGPVFYRAVRVGRGGQTFSLLKLRTMRADKGDGPRVTQKGDLRITRVGRALRKTKLDETPQFLNILRGEMSLVGPRPEDPVYVAQYTPSQREVLKYIPGLISPAVLDYRHEESMLASATNVEEKYVKDIMPVKLAQDLAYMRARSTGSDLMLILKAAGVVLRTRPPEAPRSGDDSRP